MGGSVSGQDEPNPVLWLATRAGKMERSCPLGIARFVPQENFSLFGVLSHIINPLSLFGQDGWVLASFFFFESVYGPRRKELILRPISSHLDLSLGQ